MNVRPSILCPIDCSDASAGALRYAAAIAEHFATRLIVLTVEDPLLTAAMDLGTAVPTTSHHSEREVVTFVRNVFGEDNPALAMFEYEVAVGTPAVEILRVARERSCDLIVMSSHGLTGVRRLLLGSTTERVLRETPLPVLVTPPAHPGPIHLEDARGLLGRVIAPVDFSCASLHQTRVAGGLAESLNLPLVLIHVIERGTSRLIERLGPTSPDSDLQSLAEERLDDLVAAIPKCPRPETIIVFGDPAQEAAAIVRDRQAGLIVMGLHDSPPTGPRMGSVTYRMLCQTPMLVLALPPKPTEPVHRGTSVATRMASESVH